MSEITSDSATSKNEIKIEMTFEEAVEITQETYNRYNKKDIKNQIGKFDFYNEYFDNKNFFSSNFSGITYIRECENSLNVAIACRGSSKNLKDWVQNLLIIIIPISPYTFADWKARQYATNILNKIKNDEKYKDKKINIITLGHSKGGREAQKQMSKLRKQYKNDNSINICCLTFNSAPSFPIYLLPFNPFYYIYNVIKNVIKQNKNMRQNLVLGDRISFAKDILNVSFGNNCAYPTEKVTVIQIITGLHLFFLLIFSLFLIFTELAEPAHWIIFGVVAVALEWLAIRFRFPSLFLFISAIALYIYHNNKYFYFILTIYLLVFLLFLD